MRQWRVGSFSMGLVLILLGLGLVLDRFQGSPAALKLISDWWPLALILLGAEVVAAGIFAQGEKITIRYDFWSVFLVIVFFFFSLAGYAVSSSGIVPLLQETFSAKELAVTLPEQSIGLEGIDRVVLSCPDGALELRSSGGSEVRIFGRGTVTAVSMEDAELLAASAAADTYLEGNTLYIQVRELPYRENIFGWSGSGEVSRTILVPAGTALELRRGHGSTVIVLDDLGAPWSLDLAGAVKGSLSPHLSVTVEALAGHTGSFTGNAPWVVEDDAGAKATATFSLGEGTWPLRIAADWDVEIDIR